MCILNKKCTNLRKLALMADFMLIYVFDITLVVMKNSTRVIIPSCIFFVFQSFSYSSLRSVDPGCVYVSVSHIKGVFNYRGTSTVRLKSG